VNVAVVLQPTEIDQATNEYKNLFFPQYRGTSVIMKAKRPFFNNFCVPIFARDKVGTIAGQAGQMKGQGIKREG